MGDEKVTKDPHEKMNSFFLTDDDIFDISFSFFGGDLILSILS